MMNVAPLVRGSTAMRLQPLTMRQLSEEGFFFVQGWWLLVGDKESVFKDR